MATNETTEVSLCLRVFVIMLWLRGKTLTQKDSINIGIIGAGFARTTQIPGFRACAGARVTAIASGRRESAERVAHEFDIPFVGADWRDIVGRADVDLVSIVTPPSTHEEITLAALDAGKAVLCEKPTAMNADESRRMMERADGAGAFALIDHELRFLGGRQKMRDMIRAGEIGQVRHAALSFRADSRATTERAWDWWSDAKMGGGTLGAIGSHAIDSFRWLLDAEVADVCCQLSTHVAERPDVAADGALRAVTTDDEANLLLRFIDHEHLRGATANVSLSLIEAGAPLHRLEIFGARGALRVEEAGELWHAPIGAGAWQRVEVERGLLAPGMRDGGWSRGFTRFAQEIVNALREGRPTVAGAATFADGHRTQLVLDAARLSHGTGKRVAVDA